MKKESSRKSECQYTCPLSPQIHSSRNRNTAVCWRWHSEDMCYYNICL